MSGKPWSAKETELARRMIAEKAPDSEFRRRLGRAKFCAYQRLYRVDFPSNDWGSLGLPMDGRVEVPDRVRADAIRRTSAPRTLTAWICRDPAPGQSALDKRFAAGM
jgi:hypothetical protein